MKSEIHPMSLKNQEPALAARARAGDRAAFEHLAAAADERLQAAILAQVAPRLRERLDPAELRQEVLAQALASIASFEDRGEGSFAAWLCGIARHVVLGALRRSREHEPLEIVADLAVNDASPSHGLRQAERFARLEAAFERLRPEHREVLRLARIEGLAAKDIAARTGRTPQAVRQLLCRALKALRESFGDTESCSLPPRSLGGEE
jgi:RNA polymerase sigma-70 factor (ECF subfamily)